MIALSRLSITGKIDSSTPKAVIDEVLYFHKVKSLEDLINCKVRKVSLEFREENDNLLSDFINPLEKWDRESLIKAWKFILGFMGKKITVKWSVTKVGLQSKKDPYSLNACMLYRICKEWSIPTKNSSTVNDMITMIKISFTCPKVIRSLVCSNIKSNFEDNKNREKLTEKLHTLLVCLNVSIPSDTSEIFRRFDKFEKVKYNNIDKNPRTNSEAISMSAIIFNIDISYSRTPIVDYYHMAVLNSFYDSELVEIENRNRDILDLRKTFNPLFPVGYYKRETLEELCRKYGFNESLSNTGLYNNLQFNYLSDNFYLGWQIKMKRETTCVNFEDIKGKRDLITYGNFVDGFLPFLPMELYEMFDTLNNLVNPDNFEEQLDIRIINSLQNIANTVSQELSSVIEKIKLIHFSNDKDLKKISEWYVSLPLEDKARVKTVLKKVLDLGMYMRGWKGGDNSYPMNNIPYNETVYCYVTISLWDVLEEYKNEIGRQVLNMPLYKCNNGKWQKCSDAKNGITIYQRVIKIKKNDDVGSCIRMSSNWLVSSAYKYMISIGMREPFNINYVDHIY